MIVPFPSTSVWASHGEKDLIRNLRISFVSAPSPKMKQNISNTSRSQNGRQDVDGLRAQKEGLPWRLACRHLWCPTRTRCGVWGNWIGLSGKRTCRLVAIRKKGRVLLRYVSICQIERDGILVCCTVFLSSAWVQVEQIHRDIKQCCFDNFRSQCALTQNPLTMKGSTYQVPVNRYIRTTIYIANRH